MTNIKPRDYDTDAGIAMTFDTLCDRGFDPEQVAKLLDEYGGDLWMDVFGPAVDNAAGLIGLESYPADWSDRMTFEQFQATRTHCDDIGKMLADARWRDEPVPAKGNLYLDSLYIEQVQPHWPEAARKQGQWHLLIGREDWITDDLTDLEHKLYSFAVSEGILNDARQVPRS